VFVGDFASFVMSSVLSAALDVAAFWLFAKLFSMITDQVWYVTAAVVCARIMSASENYLANRFLVFRSFDDTGSSAMKYCILAVCQMGLNAGLTTMLTAFIPAVAPVIWKIITNTVLFILSYRFQKSLVFRQKRGSAAAVAQQ
jgi:putative flippase GtrA